MTPRGTLPDGSLLETGSLPCLTLQAPHRNATVLRRLNQCLRGKRFQLLPHLRIDCDPLLQRLMPGGK